MDNINRKQCIQAELVRQTLKLAPIGIVATLLNAIILVLILWKVISLPLLITWLSITFVLALLRSLFLYKYRSASIPPDQINQVSRGLVIGLGLSGLMWGSAGIFLFPVESAAHQTLVVFVLCGMVAGAMSAFSSLYRAFIAFTLPALCPILIRFITIGDDIHYAMSVMTSLYILLTLFIAKRISSANTELIDLKENLAQMIEERTTELLHTNEQLTQQIEERKHAEEKVRKAAQEWQVTFDAIKDSVCLQDTSGVILRCNRTTSNLLGKSDEEIIGHKCWELVHGTKDPIEDCPVVRATKTLKRESLILPLGEMHFEVIVDPILDEDGKPVGMVHIMSDITDRKRAEHALRESEQKYRSLFETMAQGVVYQNVQGKIISANPAAERILGVSLDQMLGRTYMDFLWKSIEEEGFNFPIDAHPAMVALKRGEEIKDVVLGVYNPVEHDDRWVRVSAIPEFLKEQRQPYRVYTTFDDITVAKQTEDERRRLEKHLQQAHKMEAIATLAGGIAHQFNNALFGITGNIDLLELEPGVDRSIGKYFESMRSSVKRMTDLTSQLLAYAQGGKYRPRNTSLNKFIEETLLLIEHTLDPAISLETHLSQDVRNIEADRTQLQMVLAALINNAAEAIEGSGKIRISTESKEIDEEFARHHPGLEPGYYACLTVKDNGRGMDRKTRDRVFEPFFTTKFQGRGLGMAAAYGIVKNHAGWIGVESELGKGTVVRIYFPVVNSDKEKAEQTNAKIANGAGTILIIEDEEALLDLNRFMLERIGYRVLEAKTGKQAIDFGKNFAEEIDLAILDMRLPDIEGKKVYELLLASRPHLKVIVCSGHAIDGSVQEVLDAGAEAFMQKPFSFMSLSSKLKSILA